MDSVESFASEPAPPLPWMGQFGASVLGASGDGPVPILGGSDAEELPPDPLAGSNLKTSRSM